MAFPVGATVKNPLSVEPDRGFFFKKPPSEEPSASPHWLDMTAQISPGGPDPHILPVARILFQISPHGLRQCQQGIAAAPVCGQNPGIGQPTPDMVCDHPINRITGRPAEHFLQHQLLRLSPQDRIQKGVKPQLSLPVITAGPVDPACIESCFQIGNSDQGLIQGIAGRHDGPRLLCQKMTGQRKRHRRTQTRCRRGKRRESGERHDGIQ